MLIFLSEYLITELIHFAYYHLSSSARISGSRRSFGLILQAGKITAAWKENRNFAQDTRQSGEFILPQTNLILLSMTEIITDPFRQKLLLIAVGIAVFMDALDGSVVNIALPVIAEEFGTDAGTISWVSVAYLVTVAGLILIFGRFADRGYVKIFFIIGFVLFSAGSVACGISADLTLLIIARVLQGAGAALIAAAAPMLCVKFLPASMLGVSMGVLTAASSVGFAIGPAIGGVITHFLSWHWIFFINIPIGIFAALFAVKIIPRSAAPGRERIDLTGAVSLFCLMVTGIFALERLAHFGPFHPLFLVPASICILSLIIFCATELRCALPMLNIRVFKNRTLTCIVLAFLISLGRLMLFQQKFCQ